jgi:hypothetical protein
MDPNAHKDRKRFTPIILNKVLSFEARQTMEAWCATQTEDLAVVDYRYDFIYESPMERSMSTAAYRFRSAACFVSDNDAVIFRLKFAEYISRV